jgi:hypothetical protein
MENGDGTGRAGAPERILDDDERSRLADVRQQATDAIREALEVYASAGPVDALGQLAWLAGGLGTGLDNPVAAELIGAAMVRARDERYPWRQISEALGEGGTAEDGRRVSDRHRRWRQNEP